MWRVRPLSTIDLRQLRYFLAAAEHGSFRKAGIALAVEGSSISRRIRDLEDGLGASLFQRHNGGVVLTLAGQRFLRQTQAAMKHLAEGTVDVGAIVRGENGHLRIGIFPSLASGFLNELLQAYHTEHRKVRLDFYDGPSSEHVAAVRNDQIDIAFVTGTKHYTDCETVHLWSEQLFAVLPSSHPLAERCSLTWSDLSEEPFIISEQATGRDIHDVLVHRLCELGQNPDVHQQNVGRDNLMSLVAIGRGLTVTTEANTSASFPGVVYRPIAGEALPFSGVWSPTNINPALRRLLVMANTLARKDRQIGRRVR